MVHGWCYSPPGAPHKVSLPWVQLGCEDRTRLPCLKASKAGCVLGFCRERPLDASPVFSYILYGLFLILNEMTQFSCVV